MTKLLWKINSARQTNKTLVAQLSWRISGEDDYSWSSSGNSRSTRGHLQDILPVKGPSPFPFLSPSLASFLWLPFSPSHSALKQWDPFPHESGEGGEGRLECPTLPLCFHGDHVRCEHCPVSRVDEVVLFRMLSSNLITLKSILRVDSYCMRSASGGSSWWPSGPYFGSMWVTQSNTSTCNWVLIFMHEVSVPVRLWRL